MCNTSFPVQKIVWSRTDQLLLPTQATQNNGILTIPNSSLSDAGWYLCVASLYDGTKKSATTSITVNPRHNMHVISIEPERQKISQGLTAFVKCKTDGDESNIKWLKNREKNLGSNIKALGSTLRIANIQVSDRGIYTCRLESNEHGSNEASAIVEVEGELLLINDSLHCINFFS